jgi:DNA-binding CsgD family transcriptional regulator
MRNRTLGLARKGLDQDHRMEVQRTVRKLLKQVVTHAPTPSTPEQEHVEQEVIFAEEVDGVRYLLLRSSSKEPQERIVLSPREHEIARMVAKGHPNKVIAAVLEISPWTVGTHLRRIFAKLGVGSRAAMVAKLLEDDLIGGQPPPEDQLVTLRHRRF